MPSPIVYLELPTANIAADKAFYAGLFGWTFQDFGPEYATFHGAALEGGLNATNDGRSKAPLPVITTDDIATMERRVAESGGRITVQPSPSPAAAASTLPTHRVTSSQ